MTAIDPRSDTHFAQCANSVDELRRALGAVGWTVEWVAGVDGPTEKRYEGPDVVTIPTRQMGISPTRNDALGFARSEWVYSLDHDDMMCPEGVLELLADPRLTDVGWVLGDVHLLEGSYGPRPYFNPGPVPRRTLLYDKAHPGRWNGNTLLVRTELLLRAGGWGGMRIDEDGALLLELSWLSDGLIVPYQLVHRRWWDGQASRSFHEADYLLTGQFERRVWEARCRAEGAEAPPRRDTTLAMGDREYAMTAWPVRGMTAP